MREATTVARSRAPDDSRSGTARRMQMRYGFNEVDAWWHVARGPYRDVIRQRLKRMGTQVVRIFVFDKPVPHPVWEWPLFADYVQAVLDVGAKPMITFAKYHPPHDDARALEGYVARAQEIVWSCLERWGGAEVSGWLWCIWNEPNNVPVGGDVGYEQYARIYRKTATAIHALLEPHLAGRKARIGGPALDGFQPYWLDWIARLLNDVDEHLVGFVSWHHYGDWRPVPPSATLGVELIGSPDAPREQTYERLIMGQTPEYEARARAVARLIAGRDILNVCGELNSIVHHDHAYAGGLNQDAFGAAYYASALIHLIRGGADLEMRWVATANDDAYGLMTMNGEPTRACLAKELFAQHVRLGNLIEFPAYQPRMANLDAIVTCGADGRWAGVFAHVSRHKGTIDVASWHPMLAHCDTILRVDKTTLRGPACERLAGPVTVDGYSVVVVRCGEPAATAPY